MFNLVVLRISQKITLMPYFIAYLVTGLIISFVHPELRKTLVEST